MTDNRTYLRLLSSLSDEEAASLALRAQMPLRAIHQIFAPPTASPEYALFLLNHEVEAVHGYLVLGERHLVLVTLTDHLGWFAPEPQNLTIRQLSLPKE